MQSTKKKGDIGEIVAIKYLQSKGYKLLDTNFKFGRFGEVDLICELDSRLYFIEVKYRTNSNYGEPEESITANKLYKCRKTVEYYCKKNNRDLDNIQFDAIAITKGQKSYKLKHYKNIEI